CCNLYRYLHLSLEFIYCIFLYYFFFFFQAEDGIRDDLVTGVQTCALPISGRIGSITARPHEIPGVGGNVAGIALSDILEIKLVRVGYAIPCAVWFQSLVDARNRNQRLFAGSNGRNLMNGNFHFRELVFYGLLLAIEDGAGKQ